MSQPVVQKEVLKFIGSKHLQKHQIGIAGIFYVMTRDGRDAPDIVGSVINIGIPSLVDEAPTHSPSIPPLARTAPEPRTRGEVLEQHRLATIDKRIYRSREHGIPCALKNGGACFVRRQFNHGEYYEYRWQVGHAFRISIALVGDAARGPDRHQC
jgi:hypothetical protein